MGLDLDFDNARLFSPGERQERCPTGRAVLRFRTQVMHFGYHQQGRTLTLEIL